MRATIVFTFSLYLIANTSFAQEMSAEELALAELDWIFGPSLVDIGNEAEILLPEGYDFLNPEDTAVLMDYMQNPGSVNEYYFAPAAGNWFAVFQYDDSGYVKDDETLDPEDIIDSIRRGTAIANQERRKRSWPEISIVGWQYRPFYEPETNRLAWAILAASEGENIINYNTRILGRSGVMSVTLVADPATLDADVREFQTALAGFSYKPGNRYAEYRPGDKTAAYGLAALVAGGAAAAVVKSGAGKGLFKAILVGIAAMVAALGAAVRRIFGKTN